MLNQQLLRGPENTITLIGVIVRSRVEKIAASADMKRMQLHQVLIAPEDRGALCFLWWSNDDIAKNPKIHQILVHIFGAKSSPSVAGYALYRKMAQDNKEDFSRCTKVLEINEKIQSQFCVKIRKFSPDFRKL